MVVVSLAVASVAVLAVASVPAGAVGANDPGPTPTTVTVTSSTRDTVTVTTTATAPPSTVTVTTTQSPPMDSGAAAPASPDPGPASWTDASDDDIRAAVASAVEVTRRYWPDAFAARLDGTGAPETWSAPDLWNGDGFYDSDRGTVADCGDGKDYTANAFFCGSASSGTGFLAWDLQFFRRHTELGETMVYMVVAHETGHAVQARLVHDGDGRALFDGSPAYELQADCLGGAALGRAVRAGELTLPADASDEMLRVAQAFSGPGHGSADQRNASFQAGFGGGDLDTCLNR